MRCVYHKAVDGRAGVGRAVCGTKGATFCVQPALAERIAAGKCPGMTMCKRCATK